MSTGPNNKRSYPTVNAPIVNAAVNIPKKFTVGDIVTYIKRVIVKGKISADQNDIERDTMYKAVINSIVGDSAKIDYNPTKDLILAASEAAPEICYDKYDNNQYKIETVPLTTLSDISVYNDKYSRVCELARMKERLEKSRANAAAAAPKRSFFNKLFRKKTPQTRKRKSSRKTRKQRRL